MGSMNHVMKVVPALPAQPVLQVHELLVALLGKQSEGLRQEKRVSLSGNTG